ncbi:hypothetical protein GCM10023332_22660 [Luteimonas vadosa]|uniref:Uncharacterized protein n=1 Tax=Luteimonas vadosa TaxID=1165507 RepID=A0ABP9E550_9GAMM
MSVDDEGVAGQLYGGRWGVGRDGGQRDGEAEAAPEDEAMHGSSGQQEGPHSVPDCRSGFSRACTAAAWRVELHAAA